MSGALITEGNALGKFGAQVMRPVSTQAVTYTTATYSTALGAHTNIVRVIADADVYLAFGAVATATGIRVPANTVEYFAAQPGEQISCYDGSS